MSVHVTHQLPAHPVNDSVILDIQLLISYCKLHALLIRLRAACSLLAMVFLFTFICKPQVDLQGALEM